MEGLPTSHILVPISYFEELCRRAYSGAPAPDAPREVVTPSNIEAPDEPPVGPTPEIFSMRDPGELPGYTPQGHAARRLAPVSAPPSAKKEGEGENLRAVTTEG